MPITNYYWDVDTDNVFLEEDENGNTIAEYTQEPNLYGELIAQERDGQASFYDFDGEGSTRELSDPNQQVTDTYTYDAFGVEVTKTGTTVTPFRYKGALGYYARLETNTVEARRRLYAVQAGRWTSRDPMLFVDGTNRFLFTQNNPINHDDPSGLELINFYFNAFINGSRGKWLPEPFSLIHYFKTDERDFGESGSSRISSSGSIDSCEIGRARPTGTNEAGWSHRRTFWPTQAFSPWYYWPARKTKLNPNVVDPHQPKKCEHSQINFKAAGNYPYIPASPNIDYWVIFVILISAPDAVEVLAFGRHDGFPDYEVVVEIEGTRHLLYQYKSPYPGPSIWSLGGGPEQAFASSGTFYIETPGCCPKSGTCSTANE